MKRQLVHMGLGFVVLSIGFATTPRAWGDDLSQALHIWGSGSSAVQQVPAEALERLKTTRVRKITDGLDSFHVGMLFEDGTAFLWGDNSFGQCTPPAGVGTANDPIQNLDVGTHHTIALMDDGRVECWGRTDNYACDVPSKLFGPSDPVIDVAAGTDYSACLLQSGTIIAWGIGAGWGSFPNNGGQPPFLSQFSSSELLETKLGVSGVAGTLLAGGKLALSVGYPNGYAVTTGNSYFSIPSQLPGVGTTDSVAAIVVGDRGGATLGASGYCERYGYDVYSSQNPPDAYSYCELTGGANSQYGDNVLLRSDGFLWHQGLFSSSLGDYDDDGPIRFVTSGIHGDGLVELGSAAGNVAFAVGTPYIQNLDSGRFDINLTNAINQASDGDEIYAIESLVTGDVLDFYDRPVMVASRGEILVPADESWTLAGSARLGSFDATRIEGGLQVAANAAVSLTPNRGGEVPFAIEVESGGRLSLNNNSALQVTAETDILIDGEANLSSNAILFNDVGGGIEVSATGELVALDANIRMASLVVSDDASGRGRGFCLESTFDVGHTTLAGGVLNLLDGTIIGDVTVDQGLAHGGSLNASGTIFGNAFIAGGRVTSLDDLVIVGDLINGADGVVAVQVGTLYVTGGVVNEGQIYGEVVGAPGFMGGGQTAPGDGMTIAGDLELGPDASIRFSEPLWRITLGGDFNVAITSPSQFELIGSTLRLDGASGGIQHAEATSRDIGPEPLAFSDPPPGVSLIRELQVASETVVVDHHVNGGGKQAGTEAIYAARLEVEAGASLTLGNHILYCTEAQINGTVDRPENIVVVSILPDPDFNNDGIVNGADLAFILAFWGSNDPDVDLNGDGMIDAADLGLLLGDWGPQ